MSSDSPEWLLGIPEAHVNKLRILCALTPEEYFFGPKSRVQPDIEPPPFFDYRAVHVMLALARPALDQNTLERWNYLVQARRGYFEVQHKFFDLYHALQDAEAFGRIMFERKCELEQQLLKDEKDTALMQSLEKRRNNLDDLTCILARNRRDVADLVRKVREKAKARDQATAWLSNMKIQLSRNDLPHLVFLAKQNYQAKMNQALEKGEHIQDLKASREGYRFIISNDRRG